MPARGLVDHTPLGDKLLVEDGRVRSGYLVETDADAEAASRACVTGS